MAYTGMWGCAAGQGMGFLPLCPKQGTYFNHIISGEFFLIQ